MQNMMSNYPATRQIDILLFDAFSALCLANTVEPFRAANSFLKSPAYSWRFLTLDGQPAVSSSGMEIRAHAAVSRCSGDLLIAMPSYEYRAYANDTTARALRAASHRYDKLAGFDTGAWLLADAGLLDGRRSTIHWEEIDRFAEAFPQVIVERKKHVFDLDRISCSGALAAFDAVLDLIEQHLGPALRLQVAILFMSAEATGDHGAIVARDKFVSRAIAVMQACVEPALPIGEVARRVGLSQKELEIRFRSELSTTPKAVYRRLRLLLARKLTLETDLTIGEITLRCGYENPSAMTRAFKAEFDETPLRIRKARSR